MIDIGKMNRLEVINTTDFGFYLDGQDHEDILLPKRYAPAELKPEEFIDVFVYLDSEDRLIATTQKPKAMVGEFAYLKVVDVNQTGAFMDWGLPKDLFVPHKEQKDVMVVGQSYLVKLYVDNTGRIAASSKLDKFLSPWPVEYEEGQEVELLLCEPTDLGFKAIVEEKKWGLIYANEVFQELKMGERIRGFIKKMRDDDKIDLSLKKPQFEKEPTLLTEIIEYLKKNGGRSDLTDKSSPAEISKIFGVSKSQFKNAIGMLYRKRKIKIEKAGIVLVEK